MTPTELIRAAKSYGYTINAGGEAFGPSGKKLKPMEHKRYLNITIWDKERKRAKQIAIHRIQAYQKFGEAMFEPGICVRHLDGDYFNNRHDNIAIGTASENQLDRPLEKRLEATAIGLNACRIFPHEEIIAFVKSGFSYKKAVEKFGLSNKGMVSFIMHRSRAAKNKAGRSAKAH